MKYVALIMVMLSTLCVGVTATTAAAQDSKSAVVQETKGKTCRMEQQCHWVNFKKICTYVKVCR